MLSTSLQPSVNGTARTLFTASSAMRKVSEAVTRAAAQPWHVLLCGEPGTGREVVARAIHDRRWGQRAPFVNVDCASNGGDVSVELFGVPFSDGRRMDRRTIQQISRGCRLYDGLGGTVFFENLLELPARLQISLARLLRDREAVIADEGEPIEFDARVIAAIDPMPDRAVADGRLHPDLYQRLLECRIDVPPLRDRREDVPALTTYFLEDCCRRANIPAKTITQPAQQLLAALPWHGNAWELKSLIEGLVARVRNSAIDLPDVLAGVQLDGRARPFATLQTLREARVRFESDYIAQVVAQHHGRIPHAAKALGIERANLYRKLRHLKVGGLTSGRR
jgi:DNA-binding NtrC family response regulator